MKSDKYTVGSINFSHVKADENLSQCIHKHEINEAMEAKEKQYTLSEVEALVGKALRMQVDASFDSHQEWGQLVEYGIGPGGAIKDSLLSVSDVMGEDDE